MYPVLIKVYGVSIYSYGLCLSSAFLLCIFLIAHRAQAEGISPRHVLDIGLYVIAGGIAGARLFYVLYNIRYYADYPLEILLLNKGGLVFHGGFIVAVLAGMFAAKRRGIRPGRMVDMFALYLPVGQAVGRIGCFFNGCCYGIQTKSVFGVRFPAYSLAAHRFGVSHLVYPTQIYSSLANIFIFLVLGLRYKKRRFNGQILFDYMFLYGSFRFLIEFLRADNPPVFYGFNMPQLISLFMVCAAAGAEFVIVCKKHPVSA